MNIRDKLIVAFLSVTSLSVGLLAYIALENATQTIKDEVESGLNSLADEKLELIYNYIHEKERAVEILGSLPLVENALLELPDVFNQGVDSPEYVQKEGEIRLSLSQLQMRFNSYDLFLISPEGDILFTVIHEEDFGTNLNTGIYQKSLLADVYKRAMENRETQLSVFDEYAPSQWQMKKQMQNQKIGREHQSAFVATPVEKDGKLLGVVAIQLNGDDYFHLATNYSGLKNTGEIVIGKRNGDDSLVIAPLRHKPSAAFKLRFPVAENPNLPLLLAINGDVGAGLSKDYDGKEVLAAWRHIPELEWGLVVKIDTSEAFLSAESLRVQFFVIGFSITLFAIAIAVYIASRLTAPLKALVDATDKIATGDFTSSIDVNGKDEIGKLATSFNHMLRTREKYEGELKQTNNKVELALAELKEQKYALDQHAIVAITDVKGDILFANKKFSEISGYSEKELLGENHRVLKSGYHDQGFFREMYRTIARGEVWHGEVCNKAKDGRLYWVDTTIAPFCHQNGKPQKYVSIRTDITERKRAEAALLDAKDAAESATRLKSEFLANMSHEIRTPMNGVIGMTGLLLDTDLTAKQRDYAENSMKSANALLTIINDILDFSKIEAGKLALEEIPFDLQLLAEDVAEMMALKCREKGLELLLRYKPGTPRFLLGDPGRIRQIILNLLSNATKFTQEGGVLLTLELVKSTDDNVTILVEVKDTGIGIDNEKLKTIFNKFDQEDGSTTRKFGGTGLGLAICRQLSLMMDGDTLVRSEKGKGSTFSFTMTLGMTSEKLSSLAPLENKEKLAGLKTLIVDDIGIARTILSEQLSSLKLQIETASSGDEALAMLRLGIANNTPFQVVVTDFNMPEMDGEMLAEEIRKEALLEKGAFLFITSSPRKGDGKRLKKMGFDGYLIKPTQMLEVPQVLSMIWDAKLAGKDVPLVTRHTIQEAKSRAGRQVRFAETNILLVEDNPVNQMVACEYLERYGCNVTPAGNGIEAIEEIHKQRFDLIFMDCQMPQMDGYEATEEIRKYEAQNKLEETPIVAFTANAMQGDKDKCLASGMDDYMSKPVSQNALENILMKWLPYKVQSDDRVIERQEVLMEKTAVTVDAVESLDLASFNKLRELFQDGFADVVGQHIDNAEENVILVKVAIEKVDLKALEMAAHSLKGSGAQFGAMALTTIAAKMEQLAKDGNLSDAASLFSELQVAQKTVAKEMQLKLAS